MLTYFIYCEDSCKVVSRSSIRSADPHRGGIINKHVDPDSEPDRQPSLLDPGEENWKGFNETILNIEQEQHEHEARKSPRLNPPEQIFKQPTRISPRIHATISKGKEEVTSDDPKLDLGEDLTPKTIEQISGEEII